MAAATIAVGPRFNVVGNKRQVFAKLTAPADDDTWAVPGLQYIEDVQVSFPAGNLAAADAISATWSGTTVTFNVIGTARDINVTVTGV